jgi:glycosyltransferase involved in cell wall biosynthesis
MQPLYINGKFTAQRTTGVQRSAANLVLAIDRALEGSALGATAWTLLCPPGATLAGLRHIRMATIGPAAGSLHWWEQVHLPRAARKGLLLSFAGSCPLLKRHQVATFHDAAVFDHPEAYTRPFVAWYRFLFRHVARRSRLVFTVSEFSRRRLAPLLGVPPSRIAVYRSGGGHLDPIAADDSVLDRLGLRKDVYLLAVASANPTKNLAALVAAFAALPCGPGMRLVIAGGGNDAVFSRSGQPREGDDRILRTGPVSDAELKSLYTHATAFVFPSLYEGFGLPPLEAMSCGCPVLASDAASIPEVCGDAALYFAPRDSAAMTAAMRRILEDAPLRDDLRRRGGERMRAFTWDVGAGDVLSQLSRLEHGDPPARA